MKKKGEKPEELTEKLLMRIFLLADEYDNYMHILEKERNEPEKAGRYDPLKEYCVLRIHELIKKLISEYKK